MPPTSRAVVLLSGGLDSATALAEARAAGFELFALTVRYGQRHAVEIEAARRVAARSASRATSSSTSISAASAEVRSRPRSEVPKDRTEDVMAHGIPITYVPARNTVFLVARTRVGRDSGGI